MFQSNSRNHSVLAIISFPLYSVSQPASTNGIGIHGKARGFLHNGVVEILADPADWNVLTKPTPRKTNGFKSRLASTILDFVDQGDYCVYVGVAGQSFHSAVIVYRDCSTFTAYAVEAQCTVSGLVVMMSILAMLQTDQHSRQLLLTTSNHLYGHFIGV